MKNKVLLYVSTSIASFILFIFFCFALLKSGSKEEFFTNYVGFYINLFILVILFVVNKLLPILCKREKIGINKIQDLNNIILEEDKDNICIHTGKALHISYNVFDKRNTSKMIIAFWIIFSYIPFVFIILGMLPLPCPNFVESNQIIKEIFCNTTWEQFIELFIMTLASVINIIYLLLSYYEKGKTRFFVVDISKQEYVKNVNKINEKYNEIMTNVIVNESIEYSNDNPYYCVEYMVYKKRYRIMYNMATLLVLFYLFYITYQFTLGINTIFFTNFPNLLLIAFCRFSTDYYTRGLQHQVKMTDSDNNKNESEEYKQLTYYIKIEEKNGRCRIIQRGISIFENSEIKGMKIYSDYRKRLLNNRLRNKKNRH